MQTIPVNSVARVCDLSYTICLNQEKTPPPFTNTLPMRFEHLPFTSKVFGGDTKTRSCMQIASIISISYSTVPGNYGSKQSESEGVDRSMDIARG